MKRYLLAMALLICSLDPLAWSNTVEISKRSYTTIHVDSQSIKLDGKLDDAAWNLVEWTGEFIQISPKEGEAPAQKTTFKILYDDDYLYVGARAYDDPNQLDAIMARRDNFPGDWLEINIDSRHDRQTAFSFTASLSGVKGDEFISQDGDSWDGNWDPIWDFKTDIATQGWSVEMRIPFNQLRFSDKPEHIWGIQVTRRIYRQNERSTWQFIPSDLSGWVSNFGELRGLKGIKSRRLIEVWPYGVLRHTRFQVDPNNPFTDGTAFHFQGGLDTKIGLNDELTLDGTINPDFGQVEADPSQVNLSVFETYLSEKRPFFIEGRDIFDFSIGSNNLFYSRRIGRSPQYYPPARYVEFPDNSTILGAAKITGKTQNGLAVGIMNVVTAKESADISNGAQTENIPVEPLTNYFVGRLQQEYNKGETRFGGVLTATNRSLDEDHLKFLHTAAYSVGLDFTHQWQNRIYALRGKLFGSRVEGDKTAILATQLASTHYFQRPDASHVKVDSSRTALSGYGGELSFNRNGNFSWEARLDWNSPGLELNDVGFQPEADNINRALTLGYRFAKPFGAFHSLSFSGTTNGTWSFAGETLSTGVKGSINANFKNYWTVGSNFNHYFEQFYPRELRGGPGIKLPGWTYAEIYVNSDQRKNLRVNFGYKYTIGDQDSYNTKEFWLWFLSQPTNFLSITLNPWLNLNRSEVQYISQAVIEQNDRYIFGRMDQKTAGLTLRLNYSITPELSVEYYGAPFISAGKYSRFQRVTNPKARQYKDRFHLFNDSEVAYNIATQTYEVDENGDQMMDYQFGKPDFNYKDFNSNLVIRWEYRAGSALYLVWSQGRTDFAADGDFSVGDDLTDLFDTHPRNVFLIKLNRRFSW